MARLALAAVLGLFLGQAVIGFAASASALCGATCSDDRPDGRCPPACDDCTCCASSTRPFMVNPEVGGPPARPAWALVGSDCRGAASGGPRDVFHVP